jgi:hypothetical protein
MDKRNVKLLLREVKTISGAGSISTQSDRREHGSTTAQRAIGLRLGIFYAILPEGLEPGKVENWAWGRSELGYPLNPSAVLDDIARRFLLDPTRRVLGQGNDMLATEREFILTELKQRESENLVVREDELYWELAGPAAKDLSLTSLPLGSYPTIVYFYRSTSPKQKALSTTMRSTTSWTA